MPQTNQTPIVTLDDFAVVQINQDPFKKTQYGVFKGGELLSLHSWCFFAIKEMIDRRKGTFDEQKALKNAIRELKQAESEEKKESAINLVITQAEKLKWLS